MTHRLGRLLLALVVILTMARPAAAQRTSWGVSASFAPSLHADHSFKQLFNASAVDLKGADFQMGLVSGRADKGDWGVSFIHRTLKEGGFVVTDDGAYVLASGVTMNGVSIDKYAVFGTIAGRVQIGISGGAGVGWVKGQALLATPDGAVLLVDARQALRPFGQDIQVEPIVHLELVGAVIVSEQMRIRVSGGFDYPGLSKIEVGAAYFFGR